jgi:quercetin dioxygenase-like cupin family protein
MEIKMEDNYPLTKMVCVSNLWVRMMHFVKAGNRNEGHVHNFDHITLLSKGSIEVDVEGNKTIFKAPHMIYITAGKRHFLTALEDDTVASCLHALRTGHREEDILDPEMIPAGVTNPLAHGLAYPL